jgi:predicted GNAT family acetyltransferase
VTALRAGLRQQARVAPLGDADLDGLTAMMDADPIVNAVVAARIRTAGSLIPARLGGTLLGIRRDGDITAAAYSGGNLLPIGGGPAEWDVLARHAADRPRVCTSLVGRCEAVSALWSVLRRRWAPARAVRSGQPVLLLDTAPSVPGDPAVRPVRLDELDRYQSAAAAMFAEELGVSPHVSPGSEPFRSRLLDLIGRGHAYAGVDFRGQVTFKADIAAVSRHTCQIQGVWVRPDLRGRGLGTAALATVLTHALRLAPSVSLYVNDYNAPARRVYEKLGMRQVATLTTVLL